MIQILLHVPFQCKQHYRGNGLSSCSAARGHVNRQTAKCKVLLKIYTDIYGYGWFYSKNRNHY